MKREQRGNDANRSRRRSIDDEEAGGGEQIDENGNVVRAADR